MEQMLFNCRSMWMCPTKMMECKKEIAIKKECRNFRVGDQQSRQPDEGLVVKATCVTTEPQPYHQTSQQGFCQKPALTPAEVREKGLTSVMIHNLPMAATQADVCHELDRSGFSNLFDFLYVPYNLKASRICGYAFINLVSSEAAALLVSLWDERTTLCGEETENEIYFSASDEQNFEAQMQRLRRTNKRVLRDPRLRPVLRRANPDAQKMISAELARSVHVRSVPAELSAPRLPDPAYIRPDPTLFQDLYGLPRDAGMEAVVLHL